jgi:hypothetical protein
VAVAWFTAPQDEGHVFVAFSQNAGTTFGAPVRVDESGSLGRVDVELMPDGTAMVSWIELAGPAGRVHGAPQVDASGGRSAATTVTTLGDEPQQCLSANGPSGQRDHLRLDRSREPERSDSDTRVPSSEHLPQPYPR